MIKPDPSISAKDVISIQLKALQTNNTPFEDAGIGKLENLHIQ